MEKSIIQLIKTRKFGIFAAFALLSWSNIRGVLMSSINSAVRTGTGEISVLGVNKRIGAMAMMQAM